jgi:hypothetical protein
MVMRHRRQWQTTETNTTLNLGVMLKCSGGDQWNEWDQTDGWDKSEGVNIS